MGTETITPCWLNSYEFILVKLNNPLMGTETNRIVISNHFKNIKLLN